MKKEILLRYYFIGAGLTNIIIIAFTIPILFGDTLLWHPRNIPDEMMISVIYLSLGIMMLLAAKRPLAHKSLLDFSILGNTLHALVMLFYAENTYHIAIDVSGIALLGLIPLTFYPWGIRNLFRYQAFS